MKAPHQKLVPVTITTVIALCVLCAGGQAQTFYEQLHTAEKYLKQGEYAKAESLYLQIYNQDESNLSALKGLGKIEISRKNWKKAGTYLDRVLRLKQDDLEAQYLRGIVFRETGKFKALLLRRRDWNRSQRYFEKVMARDSSFQDVMYQYGLLQRYRERYESAILWGHRQLVFKPGLLEAQMGLVNFYRYLIRHRGKKEALSWLRARKMDWDAFFVAEKIRREGLLDSAKRMLQEQLSGQLTIPVQLHYLALARIYAAQDKEDSCQKAFWKAVERINSPFAATIIFDDLKYLASDDEIQRFFSTNKVEDWQEFFTAFWEKRNLFPVDTVNSRLVEHYRRLVYAEKYFEYDGFRTWFNNPDKLGYFKFPRFYTLNHEFNDKGLIYIRHGKADDWARTVADELQENESWLYYRSVFHPKMVFHFLKENAAANNWRLAPYLTDFRMLEDRFQFGPEYYRLLHAPRVERLSILDDMAQQSKRDVWTSFTTESQSFPDEWRPLNVTFRIFAFMGKQHQTELYLVYDVQPEQFQDTKNVTIQSGVAIHQLDWKPVTKLNKKNEILAFEDSLHFFHVSLPPDSYRVAFQSRAKNLPLVEGFRFGYRVPKFNSRELQLSDLVLAKRYPQTEEQPDLITRKGVSFAPFSSYQFDIKRPLHLYFEIYNLQLDSLGEARYKVSYTIKQIAGGKRTIGNLFGLLKGKAKSVTIENERVGTTANPAEYLDMDVHSLPGGEYELIVNVFDQNANISVIKKVELTLTEN